MRVCSSEVNQRVWGMGGGATMTTGFVGGLVTSPDLKATNGMSPVVSGSGDKLSPTPSVPTSTAGATFAVDPNFQGADLSNLGASVCEAGFAAVGSAVGERVGSPNLGAFAGTVIGDFVCPSPTAPSPQSFNDGYDSGGGYDGGGWGADSTDAGNSQSDGYGGDSGGYGGDASC